MLVFELMGFWLGFAACLLLPGLHDEYERRVEARKKLRRRPLLLPRATALPNSRQHE